MTRSWHEPESHFSHDAEVALAEDPVDRGAERVLEGFPGGVVCSVFSGEGAHACAKERAVWEDDFHAAVVGEVVAVRCVSDSAVDGVSEDAAAA